MCRCSGPITQGGALAHIVELRGRIAGTIRKNYSLVLLIAAIAAIVSLSLDLLGMLLASVI